MTMVSSSLNEGGRILSLFLMPELAFLTATGFPRGRDLQLNHIHGATGDPSAFTDLRNICFTPSFLAKLSDPVKADGASGGYAALLRYRAFELFGYAGPRGVAPARPDGWERLA